MTHVTTAILAVLMVLSALVGCDAPPTEAKAQQDPAAAQAKPASDAAGPRKESDVKTEKALFGAGCFWGVESTFRKTPGVVATAVGYAGGKNDNPTYRQVCEDETGHAEVVEVEYDPSKVDYQTLLNVFFENHDPTTLNRQGPDVGTQYRSVVFTHGAEQERLAKAEKAKRDASGEYVGPIVTDVMPAPTFWKGEGYHQQYFEKKGVDYVCHTGNGKKRKVSAR